MAKASTLTTKAILNILQQRKVRVTLIEPYTWKQRILAGLNRAWKVALPLLPQAADWVLNIQIPYKNTISVLILCAVAIAKALQKDQGQITE